MPASRQVPDTTPRVVDRLLPPFGALFGVALCVALFTPGDGSMARPPAFFGGWLAGLLVPRVLRWHPYRVLGLAPYVLTAALAVVLVAELGTGWHPAVVFLFTLLEGTAVGAALRYRDRFRSHPRRFLAFSGLGAAAAVGLVAAYVAAGGTEQWVAAYRGALVVLALGLAVFGWLTLLRPTVEQTVELPVRAMYRISAIGPGRDAIPTEGPVVVIANHASWFDPLMVAIHIPRPVVPLMTAGFYDLPVLRWLMVRVFCTIRVPEQAVRREAPEVQEAVAALDAGRCVVVFPEGYLRRKDDVHLRRFGQGVWQLLKARPQTPVVACWLEGVWGSYFSHHGGPPTKNKRFDVRRPVRVAMAAPEVVPEQVLDDPLKTRIYLMNRVLAARAHLGLPDLPPFELERSGPGDGDDAGGSRRDDE